MVVLCLRWLKCGDWIKFSFGYIFGRKNSGIVEVVLLIVLKRYKFDIFSYVVVLKIVLLIND